MQCWPALNTEAAAKIHAENGMGERKKVKWYNEHLHIGFYRSMIPMVLVAISYWFQIMAKSAWYSMCFLMLGMWPRGASEDVRHANALLVRQFKHLLRVVDRKSLCDHYWHEITTGHRSSCCPRCGESLW
jgi:hypothetical protein